MINFFEKKSTEPSKPKPADFRSYVDPTHEFESSSLAQGMWFTRHKPLLFRLLQYFLIGFSVITWGYVLFVAGRYLIFGLKQDQQLSSDATRFINYTPLKAAYAPANLEIGGTSIFPSGIGKVDAISEVTNPNNRWLAIATYHFDSGSPSTTEYRVPILPQQATLLTDLGLPDSTGNATLQITNVAWQRISNHDIPDLTTFLSSHLNFTVTDFNFNAGGIDAQSAAAASVKFNLTNSTAYSYRQPHFLVGLFKNQGLVGVVPLYLESFNSGETQTVDFRLFTPNVSVDSVQLYPLINIFDRANFLAPAS